MSGQRLLQLINDILDAAKMKQGSLVIKHQDVRIWNDNDVPDNLFRFWSITMESQVYKSKLFPKSTGGCPGSDERCDGNHQVPRFKEGGNDRQDWQHAPHHWGWGSHRPDHVQPHRQCL